MHVCLFFFFKQKTAYDMRISDWSSDVCSSDLLADAIAKIEADASIKGVIVTSGKQEFLAGADIEKVFAMTDADKAYALSEDFKVFLRKLETCGRPVVAALNGTALGGGLELALGCHYRVAIDNPKAQFGLPESKLGLLPGGGGTQRLPRLRSEERRGGKEGVSKGKSRGAPDHSQKKHINIRH